MDFGARLRKAAIVVAAVVLVLSGDQPAFAQQGNTTDTPSLLSAPKPSGAVSRDRLRRVLEKLQQLDSPYRELVPHEDQLNELLRSQLSNNWTITRTLPFLGRNLTLTGTLAVAPDDPADDTQPLARVDLQVSGGLDLGGSLSLKGGTLALAVAAGPDSGWGPPQFKVGADFTASFGFNDATLTANIPLKSDGQYPSYALTGDAKLGQLFPFLAKAPKISDIALKSIYTSSDGITAEFVLNGQTVDISRTSFPAGAYRMSVEGGDGLSMADIVPNGDLIPVLSDVKVRYFDVSNSTLDVQGNYAGAPLVVQIRPDMFNLDARMRLSQLMPQLVGIPVADEAQFSSVTVDDTKAVFTGSYNGKSVTVTRTRGNDATLDIAAAGLGIGDLLHDARQTGLDQYAQLDEIEVAKDHVAVDLKINGEAAEIYLLRGDTPSSRSVFFYLEKLDPATFIPNSDQSGLQGVGLSKALIAMSQANRSFTQADLPGDLGSKVTLPSGSTFSVTRETVALTGNFDLSASKTLVSLLSDVSISQTSFPVNGSLSADTMQHIPNAARGGVQYLSGQDKAQLLSRLNLSVPLSLPKLPGLDNYVSLGGPMVLSIKGNNDGSNPRVLLGGEFPVKMTIDGSELDLTASIDVDKALAGQNSTSDITIALDKAWNQPFGIPGIVVNNGSFVIDLTGKSVADLSLKGSATYAGRNNVGVTANLARNSTGSLNFQYFEFDASQGFPLSGLPGFGGIPHADQFTLDTIKLSTSGVEAKTVLNKVHVDAFIFKDAAGGAVFAVDQQGLRMVDMFPPLAGTPLRDFTLGNAAIVVSENGVSGDPKTAPAIARDLFTDIFGTSNVGLNLPKGIALLSKMDLSKSGTIATALQKIGVHADSAVVMGAVSGLFGSGSPSFNLSIMMDQLGDASGLPKNVMNYKAGTQPGFFINWAGEEVDIGVRTAMMVKAGKDTLEFDSSVEVVFSETGIGIEVLGGMDGTWHQPFGLQPLTLSDVKLETGIDALGNVSLGFKGAQTFGKESMSVATKAKFALEAEGLPDAVAFAGTADVVGPDMLLEIAQAAAGGKLDLDKVKLPFFNIKNFALSIATPGAADPQLGIPEGVSFAGMFNFMEQDLGSVKGTAGTSGLSFDGTLKDFAWGPITLKQNTIDVAISLQPKADLHSIVKVLVAEQKVSIDLTPPNLDLTVLEDLGDFGKGELKVDVTGLDLTTGKYLANADINITGKFQDDLVPRLKQVIKDGASALRQAADGKLEDDKKTLEDAQSKVDGLNAKIAAAQQAADKRKQDADARIQAAENRVNSLNSDLSHDQNEADHCGNKVTHHFCRPYWLVRKAATEAAIAVADGVLEAAKVAVNVANDLDPTVLALEAERDTARLGLSIALAVVKGSEDVVNAVTGPFQHALDRVLDSLPLTIQEVFFAGDLQQMVRNDAPLLLDMQYTLLGEQRRDYLAFKLRDWEFNAKSFAVLPSLVAEKAVANLAGQISPKVADWLNSHIGTELAAASDEIRDEVLKAEAQFEKTLQGMETNTARYQSAIDSLTQQRVQTASELGTTDFLGPSQQFHMTYIAVGHSALCLAVASDGKTVHQENCKDSGTEQWRTNPVDDYVQLVSNGLCLQAQDDTASVDKQGVLLMLKSCDAKDRSEHWKIATYDNIYSQIVNRASQKCLHFDSENARPETAKAVWTSCLGMDSQVFRPISDAEKPSYVAKGAKLASAANTCFWFHQATATFGGYLNGPCDPSYAQNPMSRALGIQEAVFDFVELVDGGIRLVHKMPGQTSTLGSKAQDGMCVYGTAGSDFFDQPCNRADGLIYDILEVQQNFMLRQRGSNLCVDVTDTSTGANSRSVGPFLMACNQAKQTQLLRWMAPAPKS